MFTPRNVPYRKLFAQNLVRLFALLLVLSECDSLETEIGIRLTRVPESRVVPPGDRVFFNCKTNIGKGEEIYWLHNGIPVDPAQRSDVRISNGQLSIKVRSAKRHRDKQTGSYQCVGGLENMFLMSQPAQLTVAHLDKFEESARKDVQGSVGNNILLPCSPPHSDPPPIIQWFKETKLLNISLEGSLINHQHLLLINVSTQDSGAYACQASNHLTGESVLSASVLNLTVTDSLEQEKPRLLYEPESSYSPVAGSDLTVPCSASGNPTPTIFWTHHAFNAPPTFINGSSGLLQLTDIRQNSSGEYTCQIFNGRGRRILRKTLVTVFERPVASISSFRNDPHREGDPLELYCNVQGFPLPRIYWVFNGKRKLSSHKLEITKLKLIHAGIYQCFAENDVGMSSAAVLVRVVPTILNTTQIPITTPSVARSQSPDLVPPTAPNVTQLSEDSVIITWMMPNITQDVQFFKVQYRDLGTREDRMKSNWYTADGKIDPPIRSYEVAGLAKNHYYRFRVAVVIDNDNTVGPVSKRFHVKELRDQGPSIIPQLQSILPLSTKSLSVQWRVPLVEGNQEVEGYFIYYRDSLSAGPYNKITIFGNGTHSHVIDNLKEGRRYDIKVRAFNVHGVGPFSAVQYQRTQKLQKEKPKVSMVSLQSEKTREPEDGDATLYLIIGCCLGVFFILLISVCSATTLVRRRNIAKKYSETNAAIHSKYQDTSRQISGLHNHHSQDDEDDEFEGVNTRPGGGPVYSTRQDEHNHSTRTDGNAYTLHDSAHFDQPAADVSAEHETSFSATDNSFGGDNSISSQGSTALAQDSSRNLTGTQSLTPDIQSLQDEYTDEPSRLSWKRRRRSEEIL